MQFVLLFTLQHYWQWIALGPTLCSHKASTKYDIRYKESRLDVVNWICVWGITTQVTSYTANWKRLTYHGTSGISHLWYKRHQVTKLKWFSSHLAVVFVQSTEARCQGKYEDVCGAAPKGGAPTASEWSTSSLSTKVRLILEVWRHVWVCCVLLSCVFTHR